MELPHDRGHFEDRGHTEHFLVAVLDSKVEERIGGGETSFWDERAVEQGLVIDPLGLPGNEPVWIFRRGWCRSRGGAESLSFGWGQLPRSHGGRSRGGDPLTQQKNERERGMADQNFVCVWGGRLNI